VPSGPPRLSRPSPDSEWSREHSPSTADTTLQPFSSGAGGVTDPDPGRDAMVRSASLSHKDRLRWPLWALLVAAAAGSTLWLSRGFHDAPLTASPSASALSHVAVPALASSVTPSAAVAPSAAVVAVAPSAAVAVAPSAVVTPSAALPPSPRDATPAKPAKRPAGGAPARAHIPSDLESPF
jgi:hypothetical protein